MSSTEAQVVIRRSRTTPVRSVGDYFVTTAKGLEEITAAELRRLDIADVRIATGGVSFRGDISACYRANLWLRTANRVLLPLAEFPCKSPQELYDGVKGVDWTARMTPAMTLAVDCTLRDSVMTHSGFVALKTKDAIVDQFREKFGRRPSVDTSDPHLRVNVHLARNRCTVSLDTSGDPLDRRGYRLARTKAPLRENLAAALVLHAGWDGTTPFIDPMCGSGTIIIEAALIAARRAPGLLGRTFAFQRWPDYDARLWQSLVREAEGMALATLPAPIIGIDRLPGSVRITLENARRAGVDALLSLSVGEIDDLAPPAPPGTIIFNPPYGVRLEDGETLRPLYRRIGDLMKQRCAGFTAWLLVGDTELAKAIGLRASRRIVLYNGPLECRLLRYELY